MEENDIDNEFIFPETNDTDSDFRGISINFGKISDIKRDTESKYDKFINDYDSEIIKLLSVENINEIISSPKYISKILLKKIKRILSLEEFKINFKSDKKTKKMDRKNNTKQKDSKIVINDGINLENKNSQIEGQKLKKEIETGEEKKEELNKIQDKEKQHQNEIKIEDKSKIENEMVESKNENNSRITLSLNSSDINSVSLSTTQITFTEEKEKNQKDFFIQNFKKVINSDAEDILNGKDFESKIKSYLKILFDYCSEQDLKVESNPGNSISFIYKLYEKLILKNVEIRNDKIRGNEKNCPSAEFDVLIKNVTKDTILNFIKKFEGNIVGCSNINKLKENKSYQIIGEVAINILHQSPDKIKQISKYIDIILINEILKKRKIENIQDIKKGFDTLNLNFDEEKILMIISNGSYIKLLKAYNMGCNIDESISLNEREKKNIKYFQKIIQLLNDSGIPYIIFFMPSDLNNKLDNYLISHIKTKMTEKDKLKIINDHEKQISDNLYLTYYIKSFEKEIDYFTHIIIENIINIFDVFDFYSICQSLYDEIIETIVPKNEINFEVIIFQKNSKDVNTKLASYLMRFNFLYYKEKIIEDNNGLIDYINENSKIPDNTFRILIYECPEENKTQFYLDKEKYFSAMIRIKNYL